MYHQYKGTMEVVFGYISIFNWNDVNHERLLMNSLFG